MDPAGQQVADTGTAGVIARPPLLFLAALLIGFVLDRLLRLPFPVPGTDLAHCIIGGSLIRNPIYLGMFLLYGGIGVAAQGPWILILTLPLAITIRYGVVAREEVYLERRFGEAYRDYKAGVRRWL
jgi:protein-S-isoprenylcysteine O-methyltransferase Ste14